eukprot:Phypoly_transcript_06282.p1 GENE.Phypoly_transcript_06282~~Phypoly_transcript_06282.p1  ORF type:complete len:551 (+),score=47.63 Phypoly_transcript_06282:60-1655(+)
MKGFMWVLLVALFFACSHAYDIWPHPQEMIRGNQSTLTLSPSTFRFTTSSQSQLLKSAIARYQSIFFPFKTTKSAPNVTVVTSVSIIVESTNEELQLGVNENYTLVVTTEGAIIQAGTVFGAMRGLESLSQLIDYNLTENYYTIEGAPILINDFPRFPWRGIMLDTSRHYIRVDTILMMIDSIAYNKMNTLHWHVIDSQSFPLVSRTYPRLAEYGAYQYPQAIYTTENITAIVQYGYERGVRVVPEFDIPGHSYTWGLGYPNLTIDCAVPDWGTGGVTLDVTNPYTYEVLDGFLAEMKGLFMDDFIHFGGDEVQYECWNMTPSVVQWMKDNDVPSFQQLEQYFENNLAKITDKNQITRRIFWEDALAEHNVTFDHATTAFEVWLSPELVNIITKMGYPVVMANGFYLDVQQPGPVVHYVWTDTWEDFYSNEPFSGSAANMTDEQKALVLGGEACMWTESTEDEGLFPRVWIRASGAAEKLWSDYEWTINGLNDTNLLYTELRLVDFRCRLKRRGINATPLLPDYCPTPEYP